VSQLCGTDIAFHGVCQDYFEFETESIVGLERGCGGFQLALLAAAACTNELDAARRLLSQSSIDGLLNLADSHYSDAFFFSTHIRQRLTKATRSS
jgi:hypothetical protein